MPLEKAEAILRSLGRDVVFLTEWPEKEQTDEQYNFRHDFFVVHRTSATGKLVVWGPVVWIPGIPL